MPSPYLNKDQPFVEFTLPDAKYFETETAQRKSLTDEERLTLKCLLNFSPHVLFRVVGVTVKKQVALSSISCFVFIHFCHTQGIKQAGSASKGADKAKKSKKKK